MSTIASRIKSTPIPASVAEEQMLIPLILMNKDLRQSTVDMTNTQAVFLVQRYYQNQENRKRFDNQIRALEKANKAHAVIAWLAKNDRVLETSCKYALQTFAEAHPTGRWLLSIYGVGPVITAGLIAHIDLEKTTSLGKLYRFAGIDPSMVWKKGQKRPFNADLKKLMWIAADVQVKFSGREECYYGLLYNKKKNHIQRCNTEGKYADAAAEQLKKFKYSKTTKAYASYQEGKLPDAHVHARTVRWLSKIMLSHVYYAFYLYKHGIKPPQPWILDPNLGGHDPAHYIPPPNLKKLYSELGYKAKDIKKLGLIPPTT